VHVLIPCLLCGLSVAYWAHQAIIIASEDPKLSKQGTVDKKKYVTLMIPQKPEIIRRLESDESQREVVTLCNIGLIYDI
jgi:hypothetical protein